MSEKRKAGRPRSPDGPRERVTVSMRRRTYDNLVAAARKDHRHSLSDMVRVILEDVLDEGPERAKLIG